MKRFIGYFILVVLFGILFTACVIDVGFILALKIWGISIIGSAFLILAVALITSENGKNKK